MITLQDWDNHCKHGTKLYFFNNGFIDDVPVSIAIAYDKTLEDYVLCFSTWNVTFKDIFKTRIECAKNAASELISKEK